MNTVSIVDPFKDGSGVVLYQFDGNVNDTGGNYDTSLVGNIAYTTGKFVQGITCTTPTTDPNSSYVILPRETLSSSIFTISLWLYVNSVNSSYANVILSTYNCALQSDYFSITIRDETLKAGFWNRTISSTPQIIEYDSLTTNKWYFLTLTVDRTNRQEQLYVNGTLISTLQNTAIYGSFSHDPRIFSWIANCSTANEISLDGIIDQLRVFNRYLTDAEITILFNEKIKNSNFSRSNPF